MINNISTFQHLIENYKLIIKFSSKNMKHFVENRACHLSPQKYFVFVCLFITITYLYTYHFNSIYDMSLQLKLNFGKFLFNQSTAVKDLLKDTGKVLNSGANYSVTLPNSTKSVLKSSKDSKGERKDEVTLPNSTKSVLKSSKDSKGVRKDECESCFVHNFKYLINNAKICDTTENNSVDVVILIFTEHKNEQQRIAIRSTWLTYSKNNTANIRYVFLLGFSKDKKLSKSVREEAEYYGDIIKEDFMDAYVNLTFKTIMGFRWASKYCPHAKFIMKTDDDMWVNVPNLLKSVTGNYRILQKAVGGLCFYIAEPHRHNSSKWYASYKSYPNKTYPGFCSGTGYVTCMTVAKKIFGISKHVPFFHLEDVYVSLCMKKLGLKLYQLKGYNNYRVRYDPCLYKGSSVVTSHEVPPAMLYRIWNKKCLWVP